MIDEMLDYMLGSHIFYDPDFQRDQLHFFVLLQLPPKLFNIRSFTFLHLSEMVVHSARP